MARLDDGADLASERAPIPIAGPALVDLENGGRCRGHEHNRARTGQTRPASRAQSQSVLGLRIPPQDARSEVEYPCACRQWAPQRQGRPCGHGQQRLRTIVPTLVDAGYRHARRHPGSVLFEVARGAGDPVGHRQEGFGQPVQAGERVVDDEHPRGGVGSRSLPEDPPYLTRRGARAHLLGTRRRMAAPALTVVTGERKPTV